MGRISMMLVALAALATACGGNDATSPQDGSVAAYCDAVAQLGARGEQIFADVDENDDAAREAAEAQLYEAAQDVGLVDSAPPEIRDDVRTFIEGVYGPDDETYDEAEVSAAEQRVLAYEEANCEQD